MRTHRMLTGPGSQHRRKPFPPLAWSLPWVPLSTDLRTIDTAANQASAAAALDAFAATWEDRYRAIVKLRRAHWAEFIPFLAFPPRSGG
jgi:Transposase, Mutator family